MYFAVLRSDIQAVILSISTALEKLEVWLSKASAWEGKHTLSHTKYYSMIVHGSVS